MEEPRRRLWAGESALAVECYDRGRMAVTFAQRAALVVLSVIVAAPTSVRAEPAAPSALQRADDLNREAIDLRSQAEPLGVGDEAQRRAAAALLERAAHKWREAARLLPADALEARRDLFCDAAAAWLQAHQLDPSRVQALRDGLATSEEFSQGPPLARNCSPQSHVEYFGKALALATTPEPPAPEPAPEAAPAVAPAPKPAPKPAPRSDIRGLKVGLWTSLGLTVAWGAVTVGTSLAVAHEQPRSGAVDPGSVDSLFMGPAYRRVFDEARALGLHGADRDLCAASSFAAARDGGADPGQLQDACAAFGHIRNTAIAGAVLTGASLVATAVLAGLVVRRRGATNGRLAWQGGPVRGGAQLGVTLRF